MDGYGKMSQAVLTRFIITLDNPSVVDLFLCVLFVATYTLV